MAKTLKASPMELDALFALTAGIPADKVSNAGRLSSFRRAIKIALKPYNDGVEAFLSVLREDAKKFVEEKDAKEGTLKTLKGDAKKKMEEEVKELQKAIDDIEKDFQTRLQKYQEDNKGDISVAFDNEAYLYVVDLFSEIAPDLFSTKRGDKTIYDVAKADALFELLDEAV